MNKLCLATATAAAAAITLAGCGSSPDQAAAAPQPTGAASSAASPASEVVPVTAQGFFFHYFETLEEMAQVNVVIGRVVDAREGVEAYRGEQGDLPREQRRVITVEVLNNLAGDTSLKTFDIETLGWIYIDGQRKELSYSGQPWLNVGDEALMAIDDPNTKGKYGFASEAGVQLLKDDKIVLDPGAHGPLTKELAGKSRSDIIEAFSRISAKPSD